MRLSARWMLLLPLLAFALTAKAQFFWGFPQQDRAEQKRETYVAPSFKGGEKAVEAFIEKNFQSPSERERVDGRIVVAVIVDTKGRAAETYVVRSLTSALDAEAVRVCQKMRFKPAQRGKKKVKGRIDITFPIRHGRVSYVDLPTIEV